MIPKLDTPEQIAYWSRVWWAMFIGASLADLISTYVSLSVGLKEANPLVAALIHSFGFRAFILFKAFGLTFAYIALLYVGQWKPKLRVYTPAGAAVVTSIVAATNAVAIFAVLVLGL